jgi:autotransporter-associated beta strand protein
LQTFTATGSNTLTFDALDATFTGVISGNGALTVSPGPGKFTFTKDNTYTGGTTLSSGTLQVGTGAAGSLGATSAAVVNNGTLIFNRSGALSYSGLFSGSGALMVESGSLSLTGGATYTGATSLSSTATPSSLTFTHNDLPGTSGFSGKGALTIEPSTSFTTAYRPSYALPSTLTSLTLGKSGNTANISLPTSVSVAGPISIQGGSLYVAGDLSSSAGGNLLMQGTGDVVVMGNVSSTGSFSATAGAASSFVLGVNQGTGVGSTLSANGGVTLNAGTSYLAGNVTSVASAINVTGNLQVANLAADPVTNPITFDSGGGAISLTGGTVSGYSGTVVDYAVLGLT